ncbi:MAG: hypothetical protein AAGF90_03225 [Pseudomonadota bacterium]
MDRAEKAAKKEAARRRAFRITLALGALGWIVIALSILGKLPVDASPFDLSLPTYAAY